MKTLKITPKQQELLNKLDIKTKEDLIHYYPYRYDTLQSIPPNKWQIDDTVCFEGKLVSPVKNNQFYKNRISSSRQTAKVDVGDEIIEIVLFNQTWFASKQIGDVFSFFGTVLAIKNVNRGMLFDVKVCNKTVKIKKWNQYPLEIQLGIKPVYRLTKDLKNDKLSSHIKKALDSYSVEEWIPEVFKTKNDLIDKSIAIKNIHFPENQELLDQSIHYLKYEEFLKFQLYIKHSNLLNEIQSKVPKELINISDVIQQIPFELSDDQKNALYDIRSDFKQTKCMYRLLQGDVGSGKTIVAFLAMMSVDCQSALLAPTELLARQHYQNFKKYSDDVVLLVANISKQEKQEIYDKIKNNKVRYIIGTHAILQDKISFGNLGFAIIDEQQRFGVKQRQALLEKGQEVDVLIMSATPIPRTLALTMYNDSDISVLKTTPRSDKKIHSYYKVKTGFLNYLRLAEAKISAGEQVYIVCSAIEDNTNNEISSVTKIYESCLKHRKGNYQIGLLHGKLSSEDSDAIMQKFANNEIQLLVTTTVIEVGVDVPNANTMIILDAQRFGLSQLHQLRGRVGRGSKDGYCYFLSASQEEEHQNKLKFMADNTDGFKISEYDLQLRGPGDVLGIRQSGAPHFILGNFVTDKRYLETSEQDAQTIIDKIDEYPNIKKLLEEQDKQYRD